MNCTISKYIHELTESNLGTFERRRQYLNSAFKFSAAFFILYYSCIIIPKYGIKSKAFQTDFIAGSFVVFGFLLSSFLSKKIKKNFLLTFPSFGCFFGSLLFLLDEQVYSMKPYMWVFPQVIGIIFGTAFNCTRCNTGFIFINNLPPIFLSFFIPHIEIFQLLENGSVVYFTTLVGIYFSYRQTIENKIITSNYNQAEWLKNVSELGIWKWNVKTNKVSFDERYCAILGYQIEEVEQSYEFWQNNIHPDDLSQANKKIENYLSGKIEKFQLKVRMKHKKGSWVTIVSQGAIFERDDKGNPLLFSGTHLDVSKYEEVQHEVEKLKDLANTTESLVKIGGWEVDVKTKEKFWSKGVYDIFEIPYDTPTSTINSMDYYDEHDRDRIKTFTDNCINKGEEFVGVFDFTTNKGKKLKIRIIGKPVYDEYENIIALRGSFQDITQEIQDKQKLHGLVHEVIQKNNYLKAIKDNAGLAIISGTNEGFITTFNPAAEKMLGYKADELINKKSPIIFHDEEEIVKRSEEFSKKLGREIIPGLETFFCHSNEGLSNNFEWTYVHKNGTKFPVRLIVTALKNEYGKVEGYIGIAEDLREKKELEDKLEQEKLKLVQSSKLALLGEMAAGVAHEVNNPLAIISGNATLLGRDEILIDRRKKSANEIKKSVDRISKIVNGLRKFTRKTNNIDLRDVSFNNLVEECMELTYPKSKRHLVSVKFNPIEKNLFIDEIQIEQILVNLIGNAIDENSKKENAWIEISYQEEGSFDCIVVKDSGKGIAEEVVDQLFNPFFTTKVIGKGTGLGLSVSKGLAKEHSGDLLYRLIDGHTAFVIKLPSKKTHQESLKKAA